jgi:hypothetical protein
LSVYQWRYLDDIMKKLVLTIAALTVGVRKHANGVEGRR